ncbi:divalent metal cation transporter [Bacteroidia bacterium]|nr:divalent metal cation transporter [Bacteroidia bacterium]MDC0560558.1 divalent metal cation transporter [Bacteroidia bacterium]MDC3407261.1 divalent metal cation transporter [Bacteroidia bacterium]
MLSKIKSLGPGLLYAGAAVGVSHLVQSTRAGAQYGYILIIAIILAHILKYPFFVLGPRYAKQHNQSLVNGFAEIGNWAIWILGVLTITTMFTIQAAVTIVTAGLVQKMTGVTFNAVSISIIILIICLSILQIGKFKILDHLMKVVMIVLSISTIVAFFLSFQNDVDYTAMAQSTFSLKNNQDLSFLVTFVGWMPAPLDIAIWHSIWVLVKPKEQSFDSDFDFKIGFYGTAFLGICFLVLGAHTLYQTGINLEASAGRFASQLIDIFVSNLGESFYWVITIAAFTTMFSTTITCFDAMPRVMEEISIKMKLNQKLHSKSLWRYTLAVGTIFLLLFFVKDMKQMVSFATTISFLTAPVIAWLCLKVVRKDENSAMLWSPVEHKLAILGILVLGVLSLVYLLFKF